MSLRFQFSLARSLVAVGLLCVAFVLHRQALAVTPTAPRFTPPSTIQRIYNPTIQETSLYLASIWDVAFGVCLALAVGVMARRTLSFLAAAFIAVLPVLWLLRTYYD